MSSDAFSFDQAVPAETMETSQNESNESSVMQSSPDGSFSQVTSENRSDSVKRQRPQIEDTERESRPTGRVKASATRSTRSVSSQRHGRQGSLRRTHEKSRSSGGSPSERKKSTTADEDLELMIVEMQSQGEQLKAQVLD